MNRTSSKRHAWDCGCLDCMNERLSRIQEDFQTINTRINIVDAEEIEDAIIVDNVDSKTDNKASLEIYVPGKYDKYKDLGYNEMTRVKSVRERDPQIVKIVEEHRCMPPTLREFGVGTTWRCSCGKRWKIKRHVVCDNSNHTSKKWRKVVLGFLSWGGSRFT